MENTLRIPQVATLMSPLGVTADDDDHETADFVSKARCTILLRYSILYSTYLTTRGCVIQFHYVNFVIVQI